MTASCASRDGGTVRLGRWMAEVFIAVEAERCSRGLGPAVDVSKQLDGRGDTCSEDGDGEE